MLVLSKGAAMLALSAVVRTVRSVWLKLLLTVNTKTGLFS